MNVFRRFRFFWITALACFAGYWAVVYWMGDGRQWADTMSVIQMCLGIAVVMQIFAWAGSVQKSLQAPAAEPPEIAEKHPVEKSTGE